MISDWRNNLVWGDYSAAGDSSFKTHTQNSFQDGTQEGKEKKGGVELEVRCPLKKGGHLICNGIITNKIFLVYPDYQIVTHKLLFHT